MRTKTSMLLAAAVAGWGSLSLPTDVWAADTAPAASDPADDTPPAASCAAVRKAPVSADKKSKNDDADDRRVNILSSAQAEDVQTQILVTMCNVRSYRYYLQGKVGTKHDIQSGFDSSIIALGIGSVAAALYKSTVPAIGGVALAASGLSAYRSYYDPEKEGWSFITAVKATRCVSSEASRLLNLSPKPYWTAMANLKQGVANVQATTANLTGTTQADQDGRTAATTAITAAEAAYAGVLAEAEAYNNAPSVIDQAHDTVKNFVDLAEHRAAPDYASVQSQLSAGIKAQATSLAETETARSQLLGAVTAQATAQASAQTAVVAANKAATAAKQPTLTVPTLTTPNVTAPASLGDAQTPKDAVPAAKGVDANGVATKPAATPLINAKAVSDLNALTEVTLKLSPNAEITTVNTAVTACVAALSS